MLLRTDNRRSLTHICITPGYASALCSCAARSADRRQITTAMYRCTYTSGLREAFVGEMLARESDTRHNKYEHAWKVGTCMYLYDDNPLMRDWSVRAFTPSVCEVSCREFFFEPYLLRRYLHCTNWFRHYVWFRWSLQILVYWLIFAYGQTKTLPRPSA